MCRCGTCCSCDGCCQPLGRYRRFVSRDLRPVYRDDELLVIGINSARRISPTGAVSGRMGAISDEQLLDVKLAAKDAPASVFKVVVTHHPFIPPPGDANKGIVHNARAALAQMEISGIDMLLAGHLHSAYSDDVRGHHEAVKRSILSVQAGTATSTRRRNEPNAYNRITIDGNSVGIEVRVWDGQQFKTGTVRRFTKIEEQWVVQNEARCYFRFTAGKCATS